jgi:endonuclease/exonuclease/phosphatase (EEP) superfamily protein YafD
MGRTLFWLLRWSLYGLMVLQLASMAPSLHPALDSLSHFRLHIALFLCVGALVVALLGRYGTALLAALVASITVASVGTVLHGNSRVPDADVTLLQFNTRFDNKTPEAILSQVAADRPDVITLQEISRKTSVILTLLQADYPYQLSCPFVGVGRVAVVSRHPLISQHCEKRSGFAWMRIAVGGKEVTIASLHLHWPWPYGQETQLAAMLPALSAMPQPAVIAGDFNAAPWSNAVARIGAATQTTVAPGLRLTLKRRIPVLGAVRVLPIDHILLPNGASVDVHMGNSVGSDHTPLIARLRLPGA